MQLSVGVEYALHSLFFLQGLPQGKVIGIKELSALHGISETYLSKVFTRLRKSGIVRSVPGVKGGYELARPASFLFQSGYLTIREKRGGLLTLDYPNKEVLSSIASLFMYGKFEAPEMDHAAQEELTRFVARRKQEGGAPTDF